MVERVLSPQAGTSQHDGFDFGRDAGDTGDFDSGQAGIVTGIDHFEDDLARLLVANRARVKALNLRRLHFGALHEFSIEITIQFCAFELDFYVIPASGVDAARHLRNELILLSEAEL